MQIEAGTELRPLRKELSQEKINRYALASGDSNPLHIDPQFAARSQFGGTIAHGMLLLAYLSQMLTANLGRPWLERGRLKARFRAPARPGDVLTASGRVSQVTEGQARCQVELRNHKGGLLVSAEAEVAL